MRNVVYLLAVAGVITFTGCSAKNADETSTPSVEDATSATDIAETMASPVDTAGVLPDSVGVLPDSLAADSLSRK